MKTLILYSSTYGYARECAEQLARELGKETEIMDIAKDAPASLEAYDSVILGGSVYMGQLHKKLKDYMQSHKSELLRKKLGLFVCSGLPDSVEEVFAANFPKELMDAAYSRGYFGGVLNKSKMSLGHKMITKMMESVNKKEGKSGPEPRPEGIKKLAEAMR